MPLSPALALADSLLGLILRLELELGEILRSSVLALLALGCFS